MIKCSFDCSKYILQNLVPAIKKNTLYTDAYHKHQQSPLRSERFNAEVQRLKSEMTNRYEAEAERHPWVGVKANSAFVCNSLT